MIAKTNSSFIKAQPIWEIPINKNNNNNNVVLFGLLVAENEWTPY